ncbi:MAG: hypothetical protein F7B59_03455 [Desulfurococcales archaeon]|nr:hypothetical protein [Desulfurococcales archaeon]
MSKAEELFRAQFLTTLKIILLGLIITVLGYYLEDRRVNAIVVIGLAVVTVSPLVSFYITLRRFSSSNIK